MGYHIIYPGSIKAIAVNSNQNKMYIFKIGNFINGTGKSTTAAANFNDGIPAFDL